MISDGQGFNTMKATDFFTGAPGVYESFDIKGSMNTSSAGVSGGYVGAPYDPAKMWADFNNQKSGATDSASAATAMYAGVKIFDNQINKTTSGADLTTFFEIAANQARRRGQFPRSISTTRPRPRSSPTRRTATTTRPSPAR